jgi:arsenite methyltransferase
MAFQRFIAHQLSNPTRVIGKKVIGPLWNKRNAKLNDFTFDHLGLEADDRVLDIGFGGGYLLERILDTVTQGIVAGMDVSPVMARFCWTRLQAYAKSGNLSLQCGRVEVSPYPDRCFTKVSSVNSIFYWNDAQQGISEIYRILQDGGQVILTYTRKEDLEKKAFVQYGIKTYEVEEIHHMLVTAGFKEIRHNWAEDRHRKFICVTGDK